ncbi:MAG: CRISPR-associated ring nuclease Csm6 [Pontiella sp.]
MNDLKTVLISVVGMSPAVLTETVWALAQENPPVIPDEVIAITTLAGKDQIKKQLLGMDQIWDSLRDSLGTAAAGKLRFGADASIQVIGDGRTDFIDIASPEENEQTADFILGVLRRHSEDSTIQIIASIAGGRKSMSALMLACMSLVGRENDRVCHVLANEEYIREHRTFCFPQNKAEAKTANIQLSEIPFIRVRGWYLQETGEAPPSYKHMVSLFRETAREAIVYPEIKLHAERLQITVGNNPYKLNQAEFIAAWTFWETRKKGDFQDGLTLFEKVKPFRIDSLDASEDFSKRLSAVKIKIKKDHPALVDRLFPGITAREFNYPAIEFIGCLQTSIK